MSDKGMDRDRSRRLRAVDRQVGELAARRASLLDRAAELTGADRDIEQVLADARAKMNEHGVAVISVAGEHTFSYTVGLTRLRHPELIITGLLSGTAHDVLNNIARLVLDGRRLATGERLGGILGLGYQVVIAGPVITAGNEAYKINVAWRVFANPGRPLQVVYPDADSRFPWEPGYRMTTQTLLAPAPGGQ